MKAVIFDLDGTLYNKRGLSLRMVLHAPMTYARCKPNAQRAPA